jgi:hypothetical protein
MPSLREVKEPEQASMSAAVRGFTSRGSPTSTPGGAGLDCEGPLGCVDDVDADEIASLSYHVADHILQVICKFVRKPESGARD